jgi:formate-dependent nitrite reductase cytochrome c552 subunit
MAITCNYNGSLCTKFYSENSNESNHTVLGFIIGSIACLIVVIVVVLVMYILCCKRRIRNKPRVSVQTRNQEQPINNVDHNQVETESNSRSFSEQQPPSYQEVNEHTNETNLYKNI